MSNVSRRDFLKLAGAASFSLAFAPIPPEDDVPESDLWPKLGRATWPLFVYERATFQSKRLGKIHFSELFIVYQQAVGDNFPHNPIWFQMNMGWVHSSSVQIVRYLLNKPVLDVPPGGFLAEVTVPTTPTWYVIDKKTGVPSQFYYSAVFWVEEAITAQDGRVWYRTADDFQTNYFVLAEHLRRIPDEELTPLSPDVLDKRIEISLKQQRLFAYENGKLAFTCKVASGLRETETPRGVHQVLYKRPSRHMATGIDVVGPEYNLPGVPWCSYFTKSGAALHGTYWHNDYGRRNSAGCVNLFPANAKWLYRWTTPYASPHERYLTSDTGTEVRVY